MKEANDRMETHYVAVNKSETERKKDPTKIYVGNGRRFVFAPKPAEPAAQPLEIPPIATWEKPKQQNENNAAAMTYDDDLPF